MAKINLFRRVLRRRAKSHNAPPKFVKSWIQEGLNGEYFIVGQFSDGSVKTLWNCSNPRGSIVK